MTTKPLKIGETVFGIRDGEMTAPGTVVGYEESERRFVLVKFADGISRPLPAESLQRPADRPESRLRPVAQGKDWEESKNLGDYLTRLGEAESGLFTKEKENEKSTR